MGAAYATVIIMATKMVFVRFGQWRSEDGRKRRTAPGGNQKGAVKMEVIRGHQGISRLLWAAKLQSALGADNRRYTAHPINLTAIFYFSMSYDVENYTVAYVTFLLKSCAVNVR